MFEYGSDPEVAHYADWAIRTSIDGLDESLAERAKLWEAGSRFSWVIALIAEDRAIGGVTTNIHDQSADIGFLLNRRYWGNGYAREAAEAVIDFAREEAGLACLVAITNPDNTRSARLLATLGFRFERMLRLAGEDFDVRLFRKEL